jgi:hypothetical protein
LLGAWNTKKGALEALEQFKGKEITWNVTYQGVDQKTGVKLKEQVPAVAGDTIGKTNAFVVVILSSSKFASYLYDDARFCTVVE